MSLMFVEVVSLSVYDGCEVLLCRVCYLKKVPSWGFEENIFHEDEVIAEEISDQTTTPNKKTKTKKRKNKHTP